MDTRPSPIAGSWYPAKPSALRDLVEHFLFSERPFKVPGTVLGILAPHAGYAYSGAIAGRAFAALHGTQPAVIAVISPYHNYTHTPIMTTAHAAYETPLGCIPVAADLIEQIDRILQNRVGLAITPVRYDREHALEIELPFLQILLPPFQLLPIMLHTRQPHVLRALGNALADTLPEANSVIIASSDLSHFQPLATAMDLDHEMMQRLVRLDPEAVLSAEQEGCGYACGAASIASMLWATKAMGANRASQIAYATSGDIEGGYDSVVGYGAAIIWRQEPL